MKKILLVEDNPSDEKLTLLAFQRSGVANEIDVVRDGAEALAYLFGTGAYAERPPPPPAIVLLDLQLPLVSGLEVLAAVRANEHTRSLPVIVLTSSSQDEDVVRAYSLGTNAYVVKPVDFGAFAMAAKTLGQFWLVLNEGPKG